MKVLIPTNFDILLNKMRFPGLSKNTQCLLCKQSLRKPWMTCELLELTQKRTEMHRKLSKQPFNSDLKANYTKFRNFVTSEINDAKRKFYQNEYNNCKNNNNDKWKFINKVIRKKSDDTVTPSLKNDDKDLISEPLEVCNVFNNYFADIGSKLAEAASAKHHQL